MFLLLLLLLLLRDARPARILMHKYVRKHDKTATSSASSSTGADEDEDADADAEEAQAHRSRPTMICDHIAGILWRVKRFAQIL